MKCHSKSDVKKRTSNDQYWLLLLLKLLEGLGDDDDDETFKELNKAEWKGEKKKYLPKVK